MFIFVIVILIVIVIKMIATTSGLTAGRSCCLRGLFQPVHTRGSSQEKKSREMKEADACGGETLFIFVIVNSKTLLTLNAIEQI